MDVNDQWLKAVKSGRIVVLPGQDSYLSEIAIQVETIVVEVTEGLSFAAIRARHPGLTDQDIIHCMLFISLRAQRLL